MTEKLTPQEPTDIQQVLSGKNDNQQIKALWDLWYKFIKQKGISEDTRVIESPQGNTWIFIQAIWLLSFDWEYFPNIIAEDEEEWIRCFLTEADEGYKVYPLQGKADLFSFSHWEDTQFPNMEIWPTIYRTQLKAWNVVIPSSTVH